MKLQFGFNPWVLPPVLMLSALGVVGPWRAAAQSTNPPAGPPRAEERARLREELQRLPPEERRERIRALRQSPAAPVSAQPSAETRRRELLQRKIEELRRKKADGSITAPERSLLERLERAMAQREAARATNKPAQAPSPTTAPTNAPGAAVPAPSP